ncbi:hypothetical protein J6590_005225 [Homalodisca vitripennis]|nr:hypothetical protein J6590_005225 [Homalodisca vitripennis]
MGLCLQRVLSPPSPGIERSCADRQIFIIPSIYISHGGKPAFYSIYITDMTALFIPLSARIGNRIGRMISFICHRVCGILADKYLRSARLSTRFVVSVASTVRSPGGHGRTAAPVFVRYVPSQHWSCDIAWSCNEFLLKITGAALCPYSTSHRSMDYNAFQLRIAGATLCPYGTSHRSMEWWHWSCDIVWSYNAFQLRIAGAALCPYGTSHRSMEWWHWSCDIVWSYNAFQLRIAGAALCPYGTSHRSMEWWHWSCDIVWSYNAFQLRIAGAALCPYGTSHRSMEWWHWSCDIVWSYNAFQLRIAGAALCPLQTDAI